MPPAGRKNQKRRAYRTEGANSASPTLPDGWEAHGAFKCRGAECMRVTLDSGLRRTMSGERMEARPRPRDVSPPNLGGASRRRFFCPHSPVVSGWVVSGWVVSGWVVSGWVVSGWVV